MGLMPVTDAAFMYAESREQPMHVGSLQIFELPEGAGPQHVADLYRESVNVDEVATLFRRRAHRSPLTLGQWTWVEDRDVDLEHHVRHSALASPGRIRELLALTSRLHGTLLDRHRPLWETHLIEGVSDGRVAIYSKMHHALLDGVSGMRLLQRSLSTDAEDMTTPMPWANVRPKRDRDDRDGGGRASLPMAGLRLAGDLVGVLPTMARMAEQGLRHQATALPGQAPKSMFNVGITGSRRFAAQSWSLERIRAVAKRADATINDVMLAMCSGALRTYLIEQDALPDSSLVAMTPVSLRSDDAPDDEVGNAVGTILCHLGTDRETAVDRLEAVKASMRAGKAAFAGLNQTQATALSAVIMAPLGLNSLLGLHRVSPPPFNLVISNVPGPRNPLYWRGARLQGLYPLSIPLHGQAMNITVVSYTGELQFGIVGCRRTVPHLQRLLAHLESELAALETSVG